MPDIKYRDHPNCTHGVLVEDFIVTAKLTGKPFIRVKFDDYYPRNSNDEYPLVRVPTNFFIYPLLKDAGVTVMSPSDAPQSFELYSCDAVIPAAVFDAIQLPTGSTLVTYPANPDTLSVNYFSEDFYFLMCDGATLMRSGEVFTLYLPDKVVSYVPSGGSYEIQTGKFYVEASGDWKMKIGGATTLTLQGNVTLNTDGTVTITTVGDVAINTGAGGKITLNGNLEISK